MKKSLGRFIFLSKITGFVFIASLFLFCLNILPVKAAVTSFTAYYLITADATPTIRGTITTTDAANTHITVTIYDMYDVEKFTKEYTAAVDGNTWSVEVDDALAVDTYVVDADADLLGAINHAPPVGLIIESADFPFEFYFTDILLEGEGAEVAAITFVDEYTFELAGFSLHFPSGTEVLAEGGVTFDLIDWAMESMNPNNNDLIRVIQFGIPNLDLHFSHPVDMSIDVGSNYNGQTLNIFTSESVGDDSADWETVGTCLVANGSCNFSINHASFFGISEEDDLSGGSKAHIDSWKAHQYEDANKSCSSRLKLTIKGKHFDKDAEVKIGSHEASSVDKKSSKELVAKFCMDKLLKNETGKKKVISVTNPDADTEKADKKINLDDIGYDMSAEDFNPQTVAGIKSIQTVLAKLGLLDEKYITGIYGPITTEAVKKFQEQNGLPQTGFVGPLTKAKL